MRTVNLLALALCVAFSCEVNASESTSPLVAARARQASDAFDAMHNCLRARRMRAFFEGSATRLPEAERQEQLRTWAALAPEQRASLHANQALAARADEVCKGLDPGISERVLYALTLRAAEFGNEQAASCFVFGAWQDARALKPSNEDFYRNALARRWYLDHATRLVERGIRQGDWRMIDILELNARGNTGVDAPDEHWHFMLPIDPPSPGAYGGLRLPNRAAQYRYLRLKQRGAASKGYADQLGAEAEDIAKHLSPRVRGDEDAKARSLYAQYFSHAPRRTGKENDICQI